MDALTILVPLITAVLVAFITYFFTRSHYEKKRKDDLADRDFNRRSKVIDKGIEETHAYLNFYMDAIQTIVNYEDLLILENEVDRDKIKKIDELLHSATKYVGGIIALNDSELTEESKKLVKRFNREYYNATYLASMIEDNQTLENAKVWREVDEFHHEIIDIIITMHQRLTQLAQQ